MKCKFSAMRKELDHSMEMAIVPSPTAISTATTATDICLPSGVPLPDDWVVEGRRRTSGITAGLVDRYYYEPDTGLKFRSLKSVEKYLVESKENAPSVKMLGLNKKEEFHQKRQMAIMSQTVTTRASSLKLPDGWVIMENVRTSGYSAGRVDKYYIEPETGLKFRSIKEVERHLTGANWVVPPPKRLKADNCIALTGKQKFIEESDMEIVAYTGATYRTPTFQLPDAWVVEEVPRSSPKYADVIDKDHIQCQSYIDSAIMRDAHAGIELLRKCEQANVDKFGTWHGKDQQYYYEPGTGQKFRSMKAVERHLNKGREKTPTPKALISGHCAMPSQNSGSQKKNVSNSKAKIASVNFSKTPVKKIKWVLTGPGGDTWSPFMGESMVPESVKQQWAKTFVLSVDYRSFDA